MVGPNKSLKVRYTTCIYLYIVYVYISTYLYIYIYDVFENEKPIRLAANIFICLCNHMICVFDFELSNE